MDPNIIASIDLFRDRPNEYAAKDPVHTPVIGKGMEMKVINP